MKQLLVLFLLGTTTFFGYHQPLSHSKKIPEKIHVTLLPSPAPLTALQPSGLFVPYWTLNGKTLPNQYNPIIYFGITATVNGIDITEDGYKNLHVFLHTVPTGATKLLTVRLLTQDINETLLHKRALQQTIISQAIQTAQANGFTGIVVDFEYNALAFPDVVATVSSFIKNFALQTHSAHLLYYEALYGDTFYRLRPYDVGTIGKTTDGIYVLAYDLHKANGDPGPAFPLVSSIDYTFNQMIQDFSRRVPAGKITVIFGRFGYDWPVDHLGKSTAQAVTYTDNEIQQLFLSHCAFQGCSVAKTMTGIQIRYTDAAGKQHEVWFDDEVIRAQKEKLLLKNGISSVAQWGYSYF
ncbi:MAG TPA: glycosyl hydrolase family 18 protein [Patescibacteria group bacterium]|nr:glycosyl hydrolase family 18 protein [Patescibacteria group bacterium]